MTLSELEKSEEPIIRVNEIAPIVHLSAESIRKAARNKETKDLLGFPVIVCGNQVRVPRLAFLHALGITEEGSRK